MMFKFTKWDYLFTFIIQFIIFSSLWLFDWENYLISIGFTLAGPLDHEVIALIVLIVSSFFLFVGLGSWIKLRKGSHREIAGRIFYYVLIIFGAIFFQNLYDLLSNLGLTVYV